MAGPAPVRGERAGKTQLRFAQAIRDHVDEKNIAPAFKAACSMLAGDDKYQGQQMLLKFLATVKGIATYEKAAKEKLVTLSAPDIKTYLNVGRDFYKLKARLGRTPSKLRPRMIQSFVKKHAGHYYAKRAESLLPKATAPPQR